MGGFRGIGNRKYGKSSRGLGRALEWITARRTGVPKGRIIRQELERARDSANCPFLRLAGAVAGPADLSTLTGFSRK